MEMQVAGPARYSTLARTGLWMAGVAPVLMILAGVVWGLELGGEVVFFLVSATLAFGGGLLVTRPGRWPKVAAIFAAVLVALSLFWTAFGLATPSSFFDFVPGVLVIPGSLFAITNAIRAIGSSSRGEVAEPAERKAARLVVTVVGVIALVSALLTIGSRESVGNDEGLPFVAMKSFEFGQDEYRIAGGSRVFVRNEDPFRHTFTIDALDIDVALTPGSEALVTLPARPGEYILYCTPHTSKPKAPQPNDMAAKLFVT